MSRSSHFAHESVITTIEFSSRKDEGAGGCGAPERASFSPSGGGEVVLDEGLVLEAILRIDATVEATENDGAGP